MFALVCVVCFGWRLVGCCCLVVCFVWLLLVAPVCLFVVGLLLIIAVVCVRVCCDGFDCLCIRVFTCDLLLVGLMF